LRFDGVVKRFGSRTIIDRLTLDIQKGEVVCFIGPSGTGKSTLLRCVNGLEEIQDGRILFEGEEVRAHARGITGIRRRIGMIFQSFNLYPHLTALQNVTLVPIKVQGEARASAEERARELFRKVRLDHRADAYPAQLSGGEQQRVAIARALATRPSLLLFDEPTSALDPETVSDVLEVMEDLAREDRTMLVVTHEISFAQHVGSRMIFLSDGRVVEDAPPATMLANPQHVRTKQFLSSIARA
jgi:ABC-type polar amino acid transport system ATPase subunit